MSAGRWVSSGAREEAEGEGRSVTVGYGWFQLMATFGLMLASANGWFQLMDNVS